MKLTEETITQDYVEKLAAKVKSKFGTPVFQWKKGNKRYSYTDWDKGYQFALLVPNEAEARRIVEQVLDFKGRQAT